MSLCGLRTFDIELLCLPSCEIIVLPYAGNHKEKSTWLLIHLQREGNVKLLSPTLEQQLTVRNPSYNFMEVHSACLLAQELNCPAFVGEFRFEIPEQLRSKVIRPDNLKEVMDCVMDKKLLEAE